jgi:hypothetical protein
MLNITIPQKQRNILIHLANKEEQIINPFIEQSIPEGIEKREQINHRKIKTQRLKALSQIEEQRKVFLNKRNNTPLSVDPADILNRSREERDQELYTFFQENTGSKTSACPYV